MNIIYIFRTIVLIFNAMFVTKSVSSVPGEDSGELSEGKLTVDNW